MAPPESLRTLLSRRGSYPTIAAAAASGRLPRLAVRLFEHVGDVYTRVEIAADPDFAQIAELRLAALVHEEPPAAVPEVLDAAGLGDFAPTVLAVVGGFGRIWKARSEADLRDFVRTNAQHLAAILLFELAHEGQRIPRGERAAELGGLRAAVQRWTVRLAGMTSSGPRST
jgi:hypothetical protein